MVIIDIINISALSLEFSIISIIKKRNVEFAIKSITTIIIDIKFKFEFELYNNP